MAVVTKTIGATGRDHSTIAAWEALLDDDPTYDSGDNAVGECYADADFTETVSISSGGTIGLADITLQAASGEGHTGTPNTGVRILQAGNHTFTTADIFGFFADLEFDANSFDTVNPVLEPGGADQLEATRCLFHNINSNRTGAVEYLFSSGGSTQFNVYDSPIFDCRQVGSGSLSAINMTGGGTHLLYNETVTDIDSTGSGPVVGIDFNDVAAHTVKNGLVTAITGGGTASCYSESAPANAVTATNLSDDATSPNSALRNKSITFENAAGDDYRLASGDTDAIDAATDLGPGNWAKDFLGRDRDAEGDIWDCGAHEFVAAAGAGTRRYRVSAY